MPRGIDVADSHIVRELEPGDLVITADIPLAADVIAKGERALNPRGELYSPENIKERLALRNFPRLVWESRANCSAAIRAFFVAS